MNNYHKFSLQRSSSNLATICGKALYKYELLLEKKVKILNTEEVYLLNSMLYIDDYSDSHINIVRNLIVNNKKLKFLVFLVNLLHSRSKYKTIGSISIDDKKRFILHVSYIPFRKTARLLPKCKKMDGGVFRLQNGLHVLEYLYVYMYLDQISVDEEANREIRKLIVKGRNKVVRKLSFYGRVMKANLVKTDPLHRMKYYCNIPLWEHQRKAIHMGCIMNEYNYIMEQRTGKTLVNACIAAIRHSWGQVNKVLIIGPISCFAAWRTTFNDRISMENRFFEFKDEDFQGDATLEVAIINFESIKQNIDIIKKCKVDMVIVDESHKIGRKSSVQSKAVHKLSYVKYKYTNTGTPIEGHIEDVWSQYKFLLPDLLGRSYTDFSDRYLKLGGYENHITEGYKNEKELHRRIHDTSFVISYKACFGDEDIPVLNIYGELDRDNRKLYNEMDLTFFASIEDKVVQAKIVLSKMIKLQQIADGFIIDAEGEVIQLGNGKLKLLYSTIKKYELRKKKTVIFARFTCEIWAIKRYLKTKGISSLILTGKDETGRKRSKEDRENIVEEFNTNKDINHMIIQTKIAKESLDLSVANHEIFYSNGFSYKEYDQARKRIRNANKEDPIFCINLIVEDTIDEVINQAMEDKQNVGLKYFYDHQRVTGIKSNL